MTNSRPFKPTAIDLFSGGGGLSVGLKKAGFKITAAVEIHDPACKTYKANHRNVKLFNQDISTVTGEDLLSTSPTHTIDLIAGCPPCQGFSSLTAKYKKDDPRNKLVFEMLRIIREVNPKSVMLENVPGLSLRGNTIFSKFVSELKKLGYLVSIDVLQVADYGVPQKRKRLVLLAGKGFEIKIPNPTHSAKATSLKPWRTVKDAIANVPEPVDLQYAKENGGPEAFFWNVTRNMSSINKARLRYAIPGAPRSIMPKDLRPDCHKNIEKGFSNVYGRLSWNEPSNTITGGCTTLSKGRFGHPSKLRTLSVREAALLQTFPANYKFSSDNLDEVCMIIGNALPCDFAKIMARQCFKELKKQK
ncbi:DNA cytosine methyltransferase [Phascolarctobacterium sp.]